MLKLVNLTFLILLNDIGELFVLHLGLLHFKLGEDF